MRHSGNSKRSRKSIWLVLAIIAVSLFFSRNAIVKTGVDISLQKIFSDASVSYFSVEWKKDGIVIENLYIESEDYHLRVPFVRLSCKFPLLQGYIEPHVFISEPQFLFLNTNSDATSFAVMPLLQSRFVAAKIDVQQGEMHFSDEVPPVYFSCKSGEEKQHVATAVFSSQDDLNPELWIDLKKEKDDFYLSTKLRQTSISRICQLMSFFYPNVRLISTANGDLEFNGEIVLKKDLSISLLNGEADVHDLRFDYSAGGLYLGAESGHFAISYPTQKIEESLPFWKKFLASVSIQEGEFFLTQPLSQKTGE